MICFFHSSDLDGHCSGALVKLMYPECTMVPINYGQPLLIDKLKQHNRIFMVDFSFKPQDMIKLKNRFHLTWLDHHISAIRDSEEHGYSDLSGKRDTNLAGCELTWNYLWPNQEMPKFVHYLGRYDVWDHYNEDILYFQYGMRTRQTWPDKGIWSNLYINGDKTFNEIKNTGKIIYQYESELNARICKAQSYTINFEGYNALVLNRGYCNSSVFDSIFNPDIHDFVIAYSRYPDCWRVSLYQNDNKKDFDLDLSVFAKKRGGGGHAGAAGFETQDITELLP